MFRQSARRVARVARLARGRRAVAAAALAAAALAALAASARLLAPPDVASAAAFPRAQPAHLAHLLADVSAHTLTIPGSWTLEEEAGNYTSWRYVASYACGPRCTGRTEVEAHERAPLPRHGLAASHLVRVTHSHCKRLPLLPWPQLCEEMEIESVVSTLTGQDGAGDAGAAEGAAEGALVRLRSRARCGPAAALAARCSSARELRLAADALLHRLRDLLHNRDYLLSH